MALGAGTLELTAGRPMGRRPSLTTNLVCEREYRNGAHAMHEDLSGAVSQIIGNCHTWNTRGSVDPDNVERAREEGWATALPRGILVIGHTKQIRDSKPRKLSFELFRRQMHGLEILTFDELLFRARNLAATDAPKEMY